MAPRTIGIDKDKNGLERYAWTILQGKDRAVTIFFAYRPSKPLTSGVHTMYDKHTRSLHTRQELRHQFLTYLKIDICEHEDKGNMIILGVDLNDLVQRHKITTLIDELYYKRDNFYNTYGKQSSIHEYVKRIIIFNRWHLVQHRINFNKNGLL